MYLLNNIKQAYEPKQKLNAIDRNGSIKKMCQIIRNHLNNLQNAKVINKIDRNFY